MTLDVHIKECCNAAMTRVSLFKRLALKVPRSTKPQYSEDQLWNMDLFYLTTVLLLCLIWSQMYKYKLPWLLLEPILTHHTHTHTSITGIMAFSSKLCKNLFKNHPNVHDNKQLNFIILAKPTTTCWTNSLPDKTFKQLTLDFQRQQNITFSNHSYHLI